MRTRMPKALPTQFAIIASARFNHVLQSLFLSTSFRFAHHGETEDGKNKRDNGTDGKGKLPSQSGAHHSSVHLSQHDSQTHHGRQSRRSRVAFFYGKQIAQERKGHGNTAAHEAARQQTGHKELGKGDGQARRIRSNSPADQSRAVQVFAIDHVGQNANARTNGEGYDTGRQCTVTAQI